MVAGYGHIPSSSVHPLKARSRTLFFTPSFDDTSYVFHYQQTVHFFKLEGDSLQKLSNFSWSFESLHFKSAFHLPLGLLHCNQPRKSVSIKLKVKLSI